MNTDNKGFISNTDRNTEGTGKSPNGTLITFLVDHSDYVTNHVDEVEATVNAYLDALRQYPHPELVQVKFLLFSDSPGMDMLPRGIDLVPEFKLNSTGGRCNLYEALKKAAWNTFDDLLVLFDDRGDYEGMIIAVTSGHADDIDDPEQLIELIRRTEKRGVRVIGSAVGGFQDRFDEIFPDKDE